MLAVRFCLFPKTRLIALQIVDLQNVIMRIALTAFAFFFGMLAHAACLAPCSYGAEEAYVVDADGNLVEAVNDIAYDNAGRLSIQGEGFA